MAMISPRDLYLRRHPELRSRLNDPAALRTFLQNHSGISVGWQRVMAATRPTLVDPDAGGTTAATSSANQNLANAINAQNAQQEARDQLAQRDAYQMLSERFASYGLGSLAPTILQYVQQGYSSDTVSLMLQESDAYKQRFAANEARRKAGYRVLPPNEYLATEESYRQAMIQAGLPKGFYDSQDDFQKLLEGDVGVPEFQDRMQAYVQAAKNTDPAYRKMIQDTFGVGLTDGDIAAFIIDPKRALPAIEKTVNSFGVADAARRQGLGYSAERANQLTELGVSADQASQQYGQVAELTSAFGRAAAAYGDQYDQTTAEDESLLGLASAKRKREKVQGEFEAYNSGSSKTSLARDTTGSY